MQACQACEAHHGVVCPHRQHGRRGRPGLPPVHQIWQRRHGPALLRYLADVACLQVTLPSTDATHAVTVQRTNEHTAGTELAGKMLPALLPALLPDMYHCTSARVPL